MHECGHGLTDMHINPEYHRTNIHRSVSMGIHESQARGLENMIGRSKPFCVYLTRLLEKYFPKLRKRTPDALYEYLNYHEETTNRVAADEVTYNLHIIIRFEIEKGLFDGTIAMQDVPQEWNNRYKDYLGVDVTSDKEGCLEDQHRSLGLFGYFPTYSLGNIIAGQLWATFTRVHPHRADEIAKGDFSSYFTRYKSNIRRHGNMYPTAEVLQRVT